MSIIVATRTLGRRQPLLADFSVPPPVECGGGGETRLRDLIEHLVRSEVARFESRQAERRFDRVLTATQIEQSCAAGKIDPASHGELNGAVDADAAVAAALQAFEDGLYLVIIDEIEHRSLDARVHLSDSSRLTFIRMTFLAGG